MRLQEEPDPRRRRWAMVLYRVLLGSLACYVLNVLLILLSFETTLLDKLSLGGLFLTSLGVLFLDPTIEAKAAALATGLFLALAVACYWNTGEIHLLGLVLTQVLAWTCGFGAVETMYRRYSVLPPGFCEKCGYDLTGNVSGVCPECGSAI